MVGPALLYSINKCWGRKAIFCTKWRQVACSMDTILSTNPIEAGYPSSNIISETMTLRWMYQVIMINND